MRLGLLLIPRVRISLRKGGVRPPLREFASPPSNAGELAHPPRGEGYRPNGADSPFPPEAHFAPRAPFDYPASNRLRKGGVRPLCRSSHPPRSRRGACSPAARRGIFAGDESLATRLKLKVIFKRIIAILIVKTIYTN